MNFKNQKVLVITSCSAKKKTSSKPIKSIDLYEGDLFKKVKKFVSNNEFNFMIISAKYGLISPDDKVLPYEKKIKNNDDITALKKKVIPKLEKIIEDYDKFLIIMGEDYKKIIQDLSDERFINFFDKRGLGGYKSLMKYLLKMEKKSLFDLIFNINVETITLDLIKKHNLNFKNL